MTKIEFYKKYANSVIKFRKNHTMFDDVNSLIFELDNYSKYPKIKTCGLLDSKSDLFEIIIPEYENERKQYSYSEIVNDINNLKKIYK